MGPPHIFGAHEPHSFLICHPPGQCQSGRTNTSSPCCLGSRVAQPVPPRSHTRHCHRSARRYARKWSPPHGPHGLRLAKATPRKQTIQRLWVCMCRHHGLPRFGDLLPSSCLRGARRPSQSTLEHGAMGRREARHGKLSAPLSRYVAAGGLFTRPRFVPCRDPQPRRPTALGSWRAVAGNACASRGSTTTHWLGGTPWTGLGTNEQEANRAGAWSAPNSLPLHCFC